MQNYDDSLYKKPSIEKYHRDLDEHRQNVRKWVSSINGNDYKEFQQIWLCILATDCNKLLYMKNISMHDCVVDLDNTYIVPPFQIHIDVRDLSYVHSLQSPGLHNKNDYVIYIFQTITLFS